MKTLAELLEADFHRIQFTPDLLPADVTGTEVFRAETRTFEFRPGPVFRSLVLADEINRALEPAQAGALDAALFGGGAWDGKAFWRAARPRSALSAFFRLQPPRARPPSS